MTLHLFPQDFSLILKVKDRFNCDSYFSKRFIFILVHKNHNHWFVVCIFPLSKVILVDDLLNGKNNRDISIVINLFLKYHNLEMSPIIRWAAENVGYKEQVKVTQLTVVCIRCLTFTE